MRQRYNKKRDTAKFICHDLIFKDKKNGERRIFRNG